MCSNSRVWPAPPVHPGHHREHSAQVLILRPYSMPGKKNGLVVLKWLNVECRKLASVMNDIELMK